MVPYMWPRIQVSDAGAPFATQVKELLFQFGSGALVSNCPHVQPRPLLKAIVLATALGYDDLRHDPALRAPRLLGLQ